MTGKKINFKNKYLILTAAVGVVACTVPEEKLDPPNILWITHEDLSPIYGCYGDPHAHTPNIDRLAESGYIFSRASSNAPICAPARSTLITGMYATSLGTQHLRSEIPVPEYMKILPEVLREAGYYTTNNVKTDYNFSHEERWDDSSNQAHWRNRPEGTPFFSVFNYMMTHEGPINQLDTNDTSTLDRRLDPSIPVLPPYIPDSEPMRQIWAHKYDLLAVFDQEVGKLILQLKEDDLLNNTIIFLFSDHGTGLPGYKRWLNNAGLHVPFIMVIPEKYKKWAANLTVPITDQLVGFVDFAPTVITLAGAEVPSMMEGRNFLGSHSVPNQYTFGFRDRADDCYEMSRSVFDGRYIYVRHFMPQLPYFQDAIIFGKNKRGSYEEIHRLRGSGVLPEATKTWFRPKAVTELFDLQYDRYEQHNLANDPVYAEKVEKFDKVLTDWMIEHFDTGLINEGDYMERARDHNTSVYEVIRKNTRNNFLNILEAAKLTGTIHNPEVLTPYFDSDESAVRYWALVAADAYAGDLSAIRPGIEKLVSDNEASVSIMAAEILVNHFNDPTGLQALVHHLRGDFEPMVLQAAISLRRTGSDSAPLLPVIENEIMPRYAGNVWNRYRNWSYPMFIGMALDQTIINNGVEIVVR